MPVVRNRYRGKVEYFAVYSELITAARYRGFITYQEIAKIIGLPLTGSHMGSEIGKLLGEVSEDEVGSGRPMLSAIALGVSGKPGPGFFALAKMLGRTVGSSKEQRQKFWEGERDTIYKTWKRRI
jgi:hypothetical protein